MNKVYSATDQTVTWTVSDTPAVISVDRDSADVDRRTAELLREQARRFDTVNISLQRELQQVRRDAEDMHGRVEQMHNTTEGFRLAAATENVQRLTTQRTLLAEMINALAFIMLADH